MDAYLSFGVLLYVLGAGLAFGLLLGWGLNGKRMFGGGDGGRLIPIARRRTAEGCEIIQLQQRKAS